MPSSTRRRRIPLGLALTAAALVCACGARGPLDIIVIQEGPADATTDGREGDASAGSEAGDARSEAEDALADVLPDAAEASPDTGTDAGALFNCGNCLAQNCSNQLIACVTSTPCTTALQCVTTMCLTGGTPNFGCITGCTNGSSTTQQQLLGLIGCVIGNCGMSCTSLLGGLGGGGGGGGG